MLTMVLVFVLAVGGVGVYLVAQKFVDEEGPTTDTSQSANAAQYGIAGERKALWADSVPKSRDSIRRLLVGGGVAARVNNDFIVGYDLRDGSELWRIKAEVGLDLCATSRHSDQGIGAVLYRSGGPSAPCTNVVAIDLASGEQLWNKAVLPFDAQVGPRDEGVVVTQGMIVVGGKNSPVAFDARSGKTLWVGEAQRIKEGEYRQLGDITLGDGEVIVSYAGRSHEYPAIVVAHDLETGRALRTMEGPEVTTDPDVDATVKFVSADPLVVRARQPLAEWKNRYFSRVGDRWVEIRVDSVEGDNAREQATGGGVVKGGHWVQAFTIDDASMGVGFDTVIAGYDLESGRLAWQYRLHRDASRALFLPSGDGTAVKAVVSDHETGLQLFAFPTDGSDPVRGGQVTAEVSGPHEFKNADLAAVAGGRLVLVASGSGLMGVFEYDGSGST